MHQVRNELSWLDADSDTSHTVVKALLGYTLGALPELRQKSLETLGNGHFRGNVNC